MDQLLSALSDERRREVEARLREDTIAWLTTVRPNGQPDSVPVWYLWAGDDIVIYSRPRKLKLRNLAANPRVTLALDDTRQGYDVIRVEGIAEVVPSYPPLTELRAYLEKYGVRIRDSDYEGPEGFAHNFSVAVIVTATKLRA